MHVYVPQSNIVVEKVEYLVSVYLRSVVHLIFYGAEFFLLVLYHVVRDVLAIRIAEGTNLLLAVHPDVIYLADSVVQVSPELEIKVKTVRFDHVLLKLICWQRLLAK